MLPIGIQAAFYFLNLMMMALAATNLNPPVSWMPLATNFADATGFLTFTDFLATNYLQQFYRISTPRIT